MTSGSAARRENAERVRGVGKGNRRKSKKPKTEKPRRDFALEQAMKQSKAAQRPTRTGSAVPVPVARAVSALAAVRRTPKRLPWEDQPDDYDRGIDRLMREKPGRRS